MIRINLGRDIGEAAQGKGKGLGGLNIPPELKAKIDVITADVRGLIIIGVSAALALLFPLFSSQYRSIVKANHDEAVAHMKAQISQLDQEIARFKPFQREMESYEEQKKVVGTRLGIVKKLLDERGAPVTILDAVGQSLPSRTWLLSMDLILSGEPSFSLAGASYSNEEISDLVEKLSESIYFNDVVLNDVVSRMENKIEVKSFSINAKPKHNKAAEQRTLTAEVKK